MKTGFKRPKTANPRLLAAVLIASFASLPVLATEMKLTPPPPAAAAPEAQDQKTLAVTPPPVAGEAPKPATMPAETLIKDPGIIMPGGIAPTAKVGSREKGLENFENKTTSDVEEVIRRLEETENNITLDDLNSARQAVAKLDILIEIEKKRSDLEKARKDNDGKGDTKTITPVSAGTLLPPGMGGGMLPGMGGGMTGGPPMGGMMGIPGMDGSMGGGESMNNLEVTRIVGTGGRYSAMIRAPGGVAKAARIGDKLEDGSKITNITSSGIELEKGEKSRQISVKNVDTVFGGSR